MCMCNPYVTLFTLEIRFTFFKKMVQSFTMSRISICHRYPEHNTFYAKIPLTYNNLSLILDRAVININDIKKIAFLGSDAMNHGTVRVFFGPTVLSTRKVSIF